MLYEAFNAPVHKLGSRGNLVLAHIPEASQGLHALREAIREVSVRLSPHSASGLDTDFLSDVMRASTLAYDFNRQGDLLYLPQCKFIRAIEHRHPIFVTENGTYVVNAFMQSLQGDAYSSLWAGAKYLE
jgi:hypothetical protein